MGMVKIKNLEVYKTESGDEPLMQWLCSFDKETAIRIRKRLNRAKKGNLGDRKNLGGGLKEMRMFFGSGYRIYYFEDDDTIFLLNGGDKSTQKKDILLATAYLNKIKKRLT